MFRSHRLLAALVLALSVTGCAGLPSAILAGAPAATGEEASVKVTIGTGYQTQAFEGIALTLRLELPYAPDPSKRVQVVSVQNGVPMEFNNLPTGYGTLTAIATNISTKEIVDKQSQPIQLKPGYQAQATFNLVIGGSSALDLNLNLRSSRHVGEVPEGDGLDYAFQHAYVPGGTLNFVWFKDDQTVSVVYTQDTYGWRRQIGDGPQEFAPTDWFQVPVHAVRVDSDPLGDYYQQVRHYRWENLFQVGGVEQNLVIDRWISPYHGLLKEEVSRSEGDQWIPVASLTREGL